MSRVVISDRRMHRGPLLDGLGVRAAREPRGVSALALDALEEVAKYGQDDRIADDDVIHPVLAAAAHGSAAAPGCAPC
jgi:hypothetical protein